MSMTNMRFEIATETEDCNACLFIKDCLSDIMDDLTFAQKRAVVKARTNSYQVQKGEMCRKYTWNEGDEEEVECVEIPAIVEIVSDLDLWP